jgi:hypothetical protein
LALWTQETFYYDASKNGYIFAYVGVLAVFFQVTVLPFLLKKFNEKTILKSPYLIFF